MAPTTAQAVGVGPRGIEHTMKRFLMAGTSVLLVGLVVFLIVFTVGKFRVEKQSYFASLSDFWFMIGTYNDQLLGRSPSLVTQTRYENVMRHARSTAHHEVRERVVWSLVRWDESGVRFLIAELEAQVDRGRVDAAAQALARMKHVEAIPLFRETFERSAADRALQIDIVDALGEMGPEAAPFLVELYHRYRRAGETPLYNLRDAIGASRGAAEFLLDVAQRADSRDELMLWLWPLSQTADPEAAEFLVGLFHHPELDVRRRARDSMAQYMVSVAADPVARLLASENDDYVRVACIELLASRDAAHSTLAVEALEGLLDDPLFSERANYALSRIASDRAIELLRARMAHKPASWVLDNLEYAGAAASEQILEDYLEHQDPGIRWAAAQKLVEMDRLEALRLLQPLRDDPDPDTRNLARTSLQRMDGLMLEESVRGWLARVTGKPVRGRLRPPSHAAFDALGFVNWLGLCVSFVLAFLLITGLARAFEPYKFALVLQFLLVSGVIGDFFFMSSGESVYSWATAGRLLLLLGLLFLRDDPLPGETRGRIERLAVRSLWFVIPPLLYFGVPLLSRALRFSLRDFDFLKWAALLLAVLTILIFEQALLPWHWFPRSARFERFLTFSASSAVTALFAAPLLRLMRELSAAGESDQATMAGLLCVPLAGAVVFQLATSGLLSGRSVSFLGLPPEPPGRIRMSFDGESLLVRFRRRGSLRAMPHLLFGLALLVSTWWLVGPQGAASGGGPSLFFLMLIAIFGTAVGWVVLGGLLPRYTIQVRSEAARCANTFLGGAVGRAPWFRRLRLPAFVERTRLDEREKAWLRRVLRERRPKSAPELELTLGLPAPSGAGALAVELSVTNRGTRPARLADAEEAFRGFWSAKVDADPADLSLSGADRHAVVPPGKTKRFHPRLYLDAGSRNATPSHVVLSCGAFGPRAQWNRGETAS